MRTLESWWPWLAGGVLVAAVAAVVLRRHLRLALRVAKALTRDERLPRPLRWTVAVGLAAKAMPVDFGVDELALGIAALLLVTRYRGVLQAVIADARDHQY